MTVPQLTSLMVNEKLSSRGGIRQGCPLSPLLFTTVVEVLGRAEATKRSIQIGKEKEKLSVFADGMSVHIENTK